MICGWLRILKLIICVLMRMRSCLCLISNFLKRVLMRMNVNGVWFMYDFEFWNSKHVSSCATLKWDLILFNPILWKLEACVLILVFLSASMISKFKSWIRVLLNIEMVSDLWLIGTFESLKHVSSSASLISKGFNMCRQVHH